MAPRKQRKQRTRRYNGGGPIDWLLEKIGLGKKEGAPGLVVSTTAGQGNAASGATVAPAAPGATVAPGAPGASPLTGGKRRSRTKRHHKRKTQRKH